MGKLNREAFGLWVDAAFNTSIADASKAKWVLVGTDIEEMSVELNSDVETRKNILGQTKTQDNGYEPSMDADPFYADPESALYEKVRDIALERKKGAECKTLTLETFIEDPEEATQRAYVREVMLKPQSYGGGTEGLNFPFNVSEDGAFAKGSVTTESIKAGNPTFAVEDSTL